MIIKRYYEVINEKFDIIELNKLIIRKTFNYNFKRCNELKAKIEKTIPHERIEIKDINDLNKIIENESVNGWIIQQIEGIQSGHNSHVADAHSGYGYGYGYSFTEGIMIVWKKL